jgi:predicted Zn-dependent peptidase
MGSAGLPALGSRATLTNLAPADIAEFFHANYRRGSATISVVGNVVPGFAAAAEKIVAALPDGSLAQSQIKTNAIPAETTRIVARRDVGAPVVVVGFAAADPGSDDYGAMLILEALLSQAFDDPSTTTLGFRERPLGAFYLYDATPASMVFYVNGNRADPSLALRALLGVAQSLAKRPLSVGVLARYKAAAVGSFVNDTVTLSDRAYMLGVLSGAGFGADPINAALAAVQRASSADVERAAKRYLQRYIVALVLPRQAPAGS